MRRGCVHPICPRAPRPIARHIFGSCVVFPEPVSPATMTTGWASIALTISTSRAVIGSSPGNATRSLSRSPGRSVAAGAAPLRPARSGEIGGEAGRSMTAAAGDRAARTVAHISFKQHACPIVPRGGGTRPGSLTLPVRWFLSIVTVLACVCSCDSLTPGMIPVDELRASFRDAWCSYLVRCGELPDLDTCARAGLHQPFPVNRGHVAAVLVGRARFDAAAAEQCFAQIAAATCDRTDDDLRPNGDGTDSIFSATANPDVCAGIVRGMVADGGRCSVGGECASRKCDVLTGDCSGACCLGTCGHTHTP